MSHSCDPGAAPAASCVTTDHHSRQNPVTPRVTATCGPGAALWHLYGPPPPHPEIRDTRYAMTDHPVGLYLSRQAGVPISATYPEGPLVSLGQVLVEEQHGVRVPACPQTESVSQHHAWHPGHADEPNSTWAQSCASTTSHHVVVDYLPSRSVYRPQGRDRRTAYLSSMLWYRLWSMARTALSCVQSLHHPKKQG